MNDNNLLRECPFCGGQAVGLNQWGEYGWFAYVRCQSCGATSKCVKVNLYNDREEYMSQEPIERLIYSWNRRIYDEGGKNA